MALSCGYHQKHLVFYDTNFKPCNPAQHWHNHPTLNEIAEIMRHPSCQLSDAASPKLIFKGVVTSRQLIEWNIDSVRSWCNKHVIMKRLSTQSGNYKPLTYEKFIKEEFEIKYWLFNKLNLKNKSPIPLAVDVGPYFALDLWSTQCVSNINVVQFGNSYRVYYCKQTNDKILLLDTESNDNIIFFTSKYWIQLPQTYLVVLAGKAKLLYSNYLRKYRINIPWRKKSERKRSKKCDNCGKSNGLSLCSVCQKVYYCSIKCQKIGWKKRHRYACIAKHKPSIFVFPSIEVSHLNRYCILII
eukprot:423790_1